MLDGYRGRQFLTEWNAKRSPGDLGIKVIPGALPGILQVQVPLVVTGFTGATATLCAAAITNGQRGVLNCGNDRASFGEVPKTLPSVVSDLLPASIRCPAFSPPYPITLPAPLSHF